MRTHIKIGEVAPGVPPIEFLRRDFTGRPTKTTENWYFRRGVCDRVQPNGTISGNGIKRTSQNYCSVLEAVAKLQRQ